MHWARSLLEWLQKHGLFLWRGGVAPTSNRLSTPIALGIPNIPPTTLRRLTQKRILHMGDLITDVAGYRQWCFPSGVNLRDLLPGDPPEINDQILWEGQFWKLYVDEFNIRPTHVIEILHVREDGVLQVGIWEMLDRFRQIERYRRREGCRHFQYADLFGRRRTCVRVDQGGYTSGRNRCYFQNERVTPTPQLRLSTEETQPEWITAAARFLSHQDKGYIPRLYTDGSFRKEEFSLETVFLPSACKTVAGGGIVIIHEGLDWQARPIFALGITDGEQVGAQSAFTMEYLAIAGAIRLQQEIQPMNTYSDCQSIVKIINHRTDHLSNMDESHRVLLQSIHMAIRSGAKAPCWVPSHVERDKKSKESWTQDEWGNYIADKAADQKLAKLEGEGLNITSLHISAKEMLQGIPTAGCMYVGDEDGTPIALNGVMEHIHDIRWKTYLKHRDEIRAGGERWVDNTLEFAALVYNGGLKSVGRYAHTARVIYDKHWDGRNRSKKRPTEIHGDTPEENDVSSTCLP